MAAGTLDWPAAWLLLALNVAAMAVTGAIILRISPDLAAERARGLRGTQRWDRWLAPAGIMLGPLSLWVVAGLDRRFSWSAPPNARSQAIGFAVAAGGYAVVAWAMSVNRFFSAAVRIQTERGHRVICCGPYRFVRHPGYVGMALSTLATPLILRSFWALIPAAATVTAVVARAVLEDRMLHRELEGYAGYAERVRYRLLPGVW